MQSMADHVGWFMDNYVGWPGKVHDSKEFVNSELYWRGTTFGRLKGRCRCLQKRLDFKLSNVPNVVGACLNFTQYI